MNRFKISFLLGIVFTATNAISSTLDTAHAVQNKTNLSSEMSQNRIDKSAEQALALQFEIEQLQQEVNNAEVYRDHLTALISSQNEEVARFQKQIAEIKTTRQGIVPLMYQMISALKQYVDNDIPLNKEQRLTRIIKLEKMMHRADVNDAEKYRRILEAYQIELKYGMKLGSYQDQIEFEGDSLSVDVIHLGRISMVARSLNESMFWVWNQGKEQWQVLDNNLKSELDKAYSIAQKHTAPSLILLPVSIYSMEVK